MIIMVIIIIITITIILRGGIAVRNPTGGQELSVFLLVSNRAQGRLMYLNLPNN